MHQIKPFIDQLKKKSSTLEGGHPPSDTPCVLVPVSF